MLPPPYGAHRLRLPPPPRNRRKAGDGGGKDDDGDDSRPADGSASDGASMAMNNFRASRSICGIQGISLMVRRTYAVGGSKAKKGGKGGGAADAPKASTLSNEVKATTVVGANILKEGTDPKILPDSEYPDWLWHLLDKRPALSELRRKNIETLPYEDLKRFVKLDNRARIKENNSNKAKH